jgi:hypothetical protein
MREQSSFGIHAGKVREYGSDLLACATIGNSGRKFEHRVCRE